ncbi:hypothetical protein A2533_03820 [Candidatus Falkowbacteria bacterium RIFOXYD2_FULL_35_9]|uniref:TraC-like domain-containing protein n=1 Tax=Candidatus Falkowbacteria bacterium RIFOXYC2_FULL_36_12 TaxID=1798002 RepID=A0A1F5SWB2_9BACT|nr:MAG: hypothetical protein A2300_00635 [Candidatus Falkowbacteria bacterium RIFOXYB2_FULL_35_7]OGF31025.1 MAG: hypothetical protein A2478_00130 [Candidatus Falkowbacteria bacterium RIFOXYC2_FULL_36_12]OGF33938.1 MAG: hypothetical protein A2223_04485 [Candidatus Falkowbacteria bacterium RIFOXYA2_FULL_35_8]OGF45984.1 MAG: hypothetical protein A2533_03820 [Candidatus Falkowbacteria bacterium RIFOXYD2_FULL_35_9]
MQSKTLAKNKITQSTQLFLDIAEIKNDTVIMKDGTLRAVMMVSSLNFALKSEDEQEAVVSTYVRFLNFLDFPIQIVIQSRKLDISNYVAKLKTQESEIGNELLRRQMVNYQAYIQELVDLGDIMNKSFFVVVPYTPFEDKSRGFWSRLGSLFTPGQVIKLNQKKFDKYSYSLNQRVEHVKTHIGEMGLEVGRLDTQSLIELYYNVYNPEVSVKQKIQQVDKLRLEE